MKHINYLCIFAFLNICIFSSCTLNREDYTEISEENFPKTENDCKLAVNALMYEFCTGYWDGEAIYGAGYGGYQVMSDMTTDNLWSCWGWESDDLYYQQWKGTGNTIDNYLYQNFGHYQFISKARNTIRRIDKSEAPSEAKTKYEAEAHCLRGWMALYLYDQFGTFPVATDDQLDTPTTYYYLSRQTHEECDTMMEKDLRTAIAGLPETAARGRMTKGAAMMILLKYYMIRGGEIANQTRGVTDDAEKGMQNNRFYKNAETLADQLYTLGKNGVYSLQDDYSSIFSKSGVGNNEIILQVGCNSSSSWVANYMTAEVLPADMPWTSNAQGWGGYVMPWAFYDTFDQGDKRLTNCVYTSYATSSGKVMDKSTSTQLSYGPLPLKYGKDDTMSGAQSGIDLVIFRYSDVLLTLAECMVRNSGNVTADALNLVNKVRTRAGLTDITTTDRAEFMKALLEERGHEFYLEGLRRQDLIRFTVGDVGGYESYPSDQTMYVAKANYRLKKANKTENVEASHNLYPINQTYIDESKSAIKQNPGY